MSPVLLKRPLTKLSVLAMAVLLCCSQVKAQSATTTMAVSATVLKVCIVLATPMIFGNYNAASVTGNDASAILTVTCTLGTPYEIAMDAGIGSGASTTTRKLSFLANTLNYQLFRDAGRSQNWGNSPGSDTVSGTGNGLLATHTVYGRIAPGQYNSTGIFLDTVTVTITY